MRVRKIVRKILIGILGVGTALTAFGCTRWHDLSPNEKAEKITERVGDKLDFNDNQSAKMKNLSTSLVAFADAHRELRGDDLGNLRDQVASDKINPEELQKLYERRRQVFDQKIPEIIAKITELHQTLNQEQRQELAEWLDKKSRRHSHR